MLVIIASSSLKPSSSSASAVTRSQFPSTKPSYLQRSSIFFPTNRRNLFALLSFAATTFLVFSVDPLISSALSNGTENQSNMRPRKDSNRRNRPSSPIKDRTTVNSRSEQRSPRSHTTIPGVSLLDQDIVVTEDFTLVEEHSVSRDFSTSNLNPRSFPYSVKQQCWDKAEKIKGRDPDRWRRDSLGNTVFRKLVGCPGCLCHDYDHIVPYSKGGPSTLENCQVLQATVNRSKGNRTEYSRSELIQKSSYCVVSGRDMDLLELSAYGNVRRPQDSGSGGCRIQ